MKLTLRSNLWSVAAGSGRLQIYSSDVLMSRNVVLGGSSPLPLLLLPATAVLGRTLNHEVSSKRRVCRREKVVEKTKQNRKTKQRGWEKRRGAPLWNGKRTCELLCTPHSHLPFCSRTLSITSPC